MLSRTADSMFWLARYMERMDYLARLLEAAQRMSGMGMGEDGDEWGPAIIAAGCEGPFFAHYDKADAANAVRFLAWDTENPCSIRNCLERARANARAMRTALTRDMWNAVNEAWLEARTLTAEDFSPAHLPKTLDWVKGKATLFNGAYASTMLRNDAYWFTRLGAVLERADNTARILDVKYHLLLPGYSGVGGMLDYYQWTSILQAVSAVRAYRWIYKDKVSPLNVADLLIFRTELPRSLKACYGEIVDSFTCLAAAYGGVRGECHDLADAINQKLATQDIAAVFAGGLHEFLTQMIEDTADLGDAVARFYLR